MLRNVVIAATLLGIAVPAWAWSQGRRVAYHPRHRVVFVGTFIGGWLGTGIYNAKSVGDNSAFGWR